MTSWVLIRGLMREMRHWGAFPQMFARELGGGPTVALDLPGNGSLCALPSATAIPDNVESCREQLARSGHAPPYRLLGLSMGAMVAHAWSERQPAEVESLVMINTSLASESPFYHRLRPSSYPDLLAASLCRTKQREEIILHLTSNIERRSEEERELLKQWVSYANDCPVRRSNALRQLVAAARYRPPMKAPPVPVLLLASSRDRLVNAECSHALARRWGCPIRLHSEAGHDLPLDDGPWVAQQVRQWLADGMAGDAEPGRAQ